MSFQLPDFFDPNDHIPAWAVALAIAVLVLAAMLPAPERRAYSAGAHSSRSIAVSNLTAV
jgi:hypothetical protein